MSSEFNPQQAMAIGWILAAVGTIVALFGIGWGVRSFALQVGMERTTGTVIELRKRYGHDSHDPLAEDLPRRNEPVEFPVVEYEVDGKKYRIEGMGSSGPIQMEQEGLRRVGDTIEILYSPDEPADGHFNTFLDRWAIALFAGGLGSLFAILGVFMVRTQRRHA